MQHLICLLSEAKAPWCCWAAFTYWYFPAHLLSQHASCFELCFFLKLFSFFFTIITFVIVPGVSQLDYCFITLCCSNYRSNKSYQVNVWRMLWNHWWSIVLQLNFGSLVGQQQPRGLKIKCVFVLVFFWFFFTALIILLSTETMKNVIKTNCQSVLPLIKNTGNARREQNTGVKHARKQIMSKSVCSEKCFSNVFIWIHKRKKALSLHKHSECFLSKLCFRRDVF